jgi:hypothetical protein
MLISTFVFLRGAQNPSPIRTAFTGTFLSLAYGDLSRFRMPDSFTAGGAAPAAATVALERTNSRRVIAMQYSVPEFGLSRLMLYMRSALFAAMSNRKRSAEIRRRVACLSHDRIVIYPI